MDQTTLLYIMTAFVIIAAVALCIQAGMLVAVNKKTKAIHDQIAPLVPKVESLVETTQATVEQSRRQLAEISVKTNEILDSARTQLAMVEEVVGDASTRVKSQMDRVELLMDDTLTRAQETVATVHNGIMRPLRELSGIAAGIKSALAYLGRGNRPSPDRATSDEEMFI